MRGGQIPSEIVRVVCFPVNYRIPLLFLSPRQYYFSPTYLPLPPPRDQIKKPRFRLCIVHMEEFGWNLHVSISLSNSIYEYTRYTFFCDEKFGWNLELFVAKIAILSKKSGLMVIRCITIIGQECSEDYRLEEKLWSRKNWLLLLHAGSTSLRNKYRGFGGRGDRGSRIHEWSTLLRHKSARDVGRETEVICRWSKSNLYGISSPVSLPWNYLERGEGWRDKLEEENCERRDHLLSFLPLHSQ